MSDLQTYSQRLAVFWHNSFKKASSGRFSIKSLILPLARIKRLMKIEEDVRMVASEVPVLFSIVAEVFIEELTFRAWINTEESKRRILQKSDIVAAVKTSQMYDFLICIIPGYKYSPLELHDGDASGNTVFIDKQSMRNNMNYKHY